MQPTRRTDALHVARRLTERGSRHLMPNWAQPELSTNTVSDGTLPEVYNKVHCDLPANFLLSSQAMPADPLTYRGTEAWKWWVGSAADSHKSHSACIAHP